MQKKYKKPAIKEEKIESAAAACIKNPCYSTGAGPFYYT